MTQNAWDTGAPITNGQLMIGSSSGQPSAATLTAGSANLTITNGAGTSTIATVSGNGDWEKITSSTASSSATIDFTGLSSTYLAYRIVISNLQPASDGVNFNLRTSTDNGLNFDAGASDYQWCKIVTTTSGDSDDVDTADSAIEIVGLGSLGSNTNEKCNCDILIFNPSATKFTKVIFVSHFFNTSTTRESQQGGGYRQSTTAIDAIRFLMSSGNIATGNFVLYGMKA